MLGDASLRDPEDHWQWAHGRHHEMLDLDLLTFAAERDLRDYGNGQRQYQIRLADPDMQRSVPYGVQNLRVHPVGEASANTRHRPACWKTVVDARRKSDQEKRSRAEQATVRHHFL